MQNLIHKITTLSDSIRYIAIYTNQKLESWQRDNLNDSSSSDSDVYEELLVNPTILKIARQRGDIDCGGLDFVIIKYGNFYQLVREFQDGHISICIDQSVNPIEIEKKVNSILNI
ncbi:MAG: hypothetical protein OEY34_01300 [Cyclobacteriaceae bacterium]|nr:hypothetical protein [Cyclobacteriaceae bacterium]